MNPKKTLIISPGEPSGIGPDITIQIAQKAWTAELVAVGDPELFLNRAKLLKLPLSIREWNPKKRIKHQKKTLTIIPQTLNAPCKPGVLNKKNSKYVIDCLARATNQCLIDKNSALVTGPIHKGIIIDSGIEFSGHTEYLAQLCRVKTVVMLFVTTNMKVALATTHLPLSAVPKAIDKKTLTTIIKILHSELYKRFQIKNPKILVCGLNPHAGENGHLGMEEVNIIVPVIKNLQKEKINVIGPLPADTIFTKEFIKNSDVILSMYHDQALPVVKYCGFGKAVNMTLGLPIIRTSVDHGTALDKAGTNKANPESLITAIKLAINLV